MLGPPDIIGSVTMNDRGQVVLPAKLRSEMGLEAGAKLLVLSPPSRHMLMLIPAEQLTEMMAMIQAQMVEALAAVEKTEEPEDP